eukprot:gene17253-17443_t
MDILSQIERDEIATCSVECAAFNVRKASRLITRLYAEALAAVELEPTQYALLVACFRLETVSVSALANRVGIDRSALARNLLVMERRGLLKVKAGVDRRVRDVLITKAGEELLSKALPLWRGAQTEVARKFGAQRLQHMLIELRHPELEFPGF